MNAPRHHYTFQSIDQAERLVAGANELLVPSDSASVEAHGRICRRVLDYVATTRRKIIEEQIAFSIWSKRNRNKASSQNEKRARRQIRRMRLDPLGMDRIFDSVGASKSLALDLQVVGRCNRSVSVPVECDVVEVHGIPGVTHRATNLSFGSERITIEEARKAKRRPFAGARLDEVCPPPTLAQLIERGFLEPCYPAPVFAIDRAISPRASYTPEPVPLLRDTLMHDRARVIRDCLDDNRRAAVMAKPAVQHYYTDEEKAAKRHAHAFSVQWKLSRAQAEALERFTLNMLRGDRS